LLKDRYRPIQPIGQGGFGKTFLAVDGHIPSQPKCVVKQLCFPDDGTETFKKVVALFRQEAIRLDELGKHPQIPQILAHFEHEQQLYLVQEFIPGKTLLQELKQQGVYSETQIWELLRDLLPVLQFIHTHRVIHRDIKPANIIRYNGDASNQRLSAENNKGLGNRQLVLIDFGVAKLLTNTALSRAGTIVGSPEYMPPEQTRGKVFPASDLYSLGVTCIHLLTGVSPLDMFDIINDCWVWQDFLPAGRKVSDRLSKILDKLLQSAVKDRYPDADAVLQAMTPTTPKAVPLPPPSPPAVVPSFFTNLWRQHTAKPEGDSLLSEVGVDYTKLQHLLAVGQWEQADEETWAVMCQALGKLPGSYLLSGDIDKLPCEDLRTIDQLWVKYSSGRFGFSVQKQIYQEVAGEYPSFCDRIGWPTHNSYFSNLKLNFSHRAPVGHLPSRSWVGGYEWWRHAEHLTARLEQCAIG
jgi:serine/threonine protein kinase